MRVLFISQYFPPEIGAPSARTYEHAQVWRDAGHDVTVLCAFPNHPHGIVPEKYRGHWVVEENCDGIRVWRCFHLAVPNKGVLKRSLSFFTFMVSAIVTGAFRRGAFDVVVATSPQLLCGLAGWVVARLRGLPFVLEIRDLWPQQIVDLGILRNRALIRMLYGLERFLYKRAKHIVTTAPAMTEDLIRRGVPSDKVTTIPNGIDVSFFRPLPRENEVREIYGWAPEDVIVMYIGTLGLSQGFETIIEAAALLQSEERMRFVIVGDGAARERIERLIQERRLSNVTLLPAQDKDRMPLFYAAGDIHLVPLRRLPVFRTNIPSKMFEIMACARPMVVGIEGQACSLLEQAQAGIAVRPEDAQAYAEAIRRLANNPSLREKLGENGRAFVVQHHDRRKKAQEFLEVLERVTRV